jgi:hypothetical protein
VQPPDEDVTTVVPPALAALVVPLTMPLPAVIETPPADAEPTPPFVVTTVQLPFGPELLPVTTVRLEPPELVTVAELLELVCAAAAVAARHASDAMSKKLFTTYPL